MPEKKATSTKKKVSKGDSYECGVCGVVVTVDECGHEDSLIMCCDHPMKVRKVKVKTAK